MTLLFVTNVFSQEKHEVIDTLRTGEKIQHTALTFLPKNYDIKYHKNLMYQIGWGYTPNATIEHKKKSLKTGIGFDVIYHMNEFSQRMIPPGKGVKTKHLIIAGDSNVFGIGNPDKETFVYLMGEKNKDYHAYNFGHGGGGPHNTLALLENYSWEKNILEKEGKMIYIFYPEWMIDRVVGTKNYLVWDRGNSPWYYLDDHDNLVRGGNFNDRFLTKILKFITKINFRNLIGDIPKIVPQDFKLVAKILSKMKAEYLKKFPSGEFIVVVGKYGLMREKWALYLEEELRNEKLPYIELFPERKRRPEFHLVDEHFNLKGNQYFVDELSSKIKF